MRVLNFCLALCMALCLSACANQRMSVNTLPKGVAIKAGITVPNPTVVRYYLPKFQQKSRFYFARGGYWLEPGRGLTEGTQTAFSTYFPQAKLLDLRTDEHFGLLIDIQPDWEFKESKLISKMKYQVFGRDRRTPLISGQKEFSVVYEFGGSSFYNAALRCSQLVLIDILNQLSPTGEKFPAENKVSEIEQKLLANTEKPISLGTGFYFNSTGQLLTAYHVLDECLIVRLQAGGKELDAKLNAYSPLLDLAVLDSSTPSPKHLSFRPEQTLVLGEMVSSVGFPLQEFLAQTPNLTRGNISAKSGMKGSLGLFQFSAPIQPGTSGGPIISEAGEVLGTTVSTLNSKFLFDKGILPQNVNFGLDAKHIVRFLAKNKLAFGLSAPQAVKNSSLSNDAAVAATVRVACYQ